ncbi:MAG: hypothetical protein HYY45_11540 [Deltaproteobacteria bacterium]|nr:hypothetical protein [Deltaproteobacteria bacterium]
MNKVLLLRIGIDSGCGGALGPIFADGTFEYVPIPESPQYVSPRSVYFKDLPACHGGTLAQYVPRRYREAAAHYDPEFDTFTYGDPGRNKRAQLLRLSAGDLLVFYAGLRPVGSRPASRLYIIGYFTVASVESIVTENAWPPTGTAHLMANAHLRRRQPDQGLVVVCGRPRTSRLLSLAVPISDQSQRVTPEVEKRMGIHGSLQRAIGRWVPSDRVADVVDWIVKECGAQFPAEKRMQMLIYKRTHSGDPDPATGVFGNHNCMRTVRGWLYEAVIGVGGVGGRAERNGIARRLTWVGIGPHKTGNLRRPKVKFDHFWYKGDKGPLLKDRAPLLADRLYNKNVRLIKGRALTSGEWLEVKKILDSARKAPPSGQGVPLRSSQKTSVKCRSTSCRVM